MILALETSTDVCSVAFENANNKIFEKRTDTPGSHSEKLFGFIKELMDEQDFSVRDLKTVLVSKGPGSYTGLRIAASGVKGLLFGSNVRLYGVSTMAAFAVSVLESDSKAERIHAIIDARRKHLYYQQFTVEDEKLKAEGDVETVKIQTVERMIEPGDIIIGTGIERLQDRMLQKVKHMGEKAISAQSLIKLYHRNDASRFIQQVNPERFDPQYKTSNQVSP